jgi:hypothetical protein
MHFFLGSPLFRLQIKDGKHEGLTYNQLDPNLVKQPVRERSMEDYVLVWLK